MANASELLKADIDHIRALLIANEADGDRRVAFLLSLATAVAAGLIALTTAQFEDAAAAAWVTQVVDWALVSLLIVSLMVFLRILHRNRLSTHYQGMIDKAWALAAKDADWLRDAEYHKRWSPPSRHVLHDIRGGHAVTVATLVSILVAAMCRVSLGANLYVAVLVGVAAFVVLFLISLDRT